MKKVFYILLSSAFICSVLHAYADEDIELERIVVTPSRVEEGLGNAPGSVIVITSEDIETSNSNSVKELLENLTSIELPQAGRFGGLVSTFLRGASSGQTQVMIDGVRVYDPISTNAAFDFAHLTLDNVERIEIALEPKSALYGSDAMGGVINIITKKGKGKASLSFSTMAGMYNTFRENLQTEGKVRDLAYAFSLTRFDSKAFSKFTGTSEEDPYENTAVSLRTDYDLSEDIATGLIGRYTKAIYEYDNEVSLKDDPDIQGESNQSVFSHYIEHKVSNLWNYKIQSSFMRNYREDSNDKDTTYPDDYLRDWYLGDSQQVELQNTFSLTDFDTLVAGFDWKREKGNYYYYTEYSGGTSETLFPKVITRTQGWFLENSLNLDDKFNFTAGMRLDHHSLFDMRRTYELNASYLFNTQTKLKSGWGTGYKAPTLYQLYALPDPWFGGGNTHLQVEESQTYEVGLEQNIFNNKLSLGVTNFKTRFKNLIDAKFNPDTYVTAQYENVSKARVEGWESQLTYNPFKGLKLKGAYTWMDTEDKTNGDDLLRRPKNKSSLNMNYDINKQLNFGLDFIYVGKRQDSGNKLLKAYNRVDLNSTYKISNNLDFFSRIENLFDQDYEEIRNYKTPGFSIYGGIKTQF